MAVIRLLLIWAAMSLVPGSAAATADAGRAAKPQAPSGAAAAAASADSSAPSVLTVTRPSGPEWFGVYLMGKKAGFSRTSVTIEEREGQRVIVARNESTISATVGQKTVRRSQIDEKTYEARPGGRLLTFSSRRDGDGGNRSVDGRCTPRECTALLVAEGTREQRRLPPVAETAEQADPARLAAAWRRTVPGEQLDLEALRVKKVQDRFVGTAEVGAGGVAARVSVVEELEVGDRAPTRISIAPDGRIVEMRMGESVAAKAEAEETAKRLDKVDLFAMTRVKLPRALTPAVPGKLVFRLKGVPGEFRVPDVRQTWQPTGDGSVVLTVTARAPAAANPGRDAPRTQGAPGSADLEPTPEIDSDAPAIQQLSREVVGQTRGAYEASTKLVHFVYRRLEKAYGVSRDRATEVLQLGKGDCTEHALLFTALARAAGIPTRQVHGLVYAQYADGIPALYWHAWAEVRSGDEWIAVDPTFDQPVADPSHIVLGRGTQVDTVGLLGALEVLSVEVKPGG